MDLINDAENVPNRWRFDICAGAATGQAKR